MKLIFFLMRCARDVRYSRGIIATVIVAGVIGGSSNAALIALINVALGQYPTPTASIVWGFVALCVVLSLSKIASQILLIRFATGTIFNLRMKMCRQILAAPLRHLERIGPHRLLATLTDDIPTITGALTLLPVLCINLAVVVSCVIYLGWLSRTVFLAAMAILAAGVLIYQLLVRRAQHHFRQAREEWDALMKHLRALVEGGKELRLHRERRQDFLTLNLEAAASALRRHRVAANITYVTAGYWGQTLSFVAIGLLLFALPSVATVEQQTLVGYTLVILYMMGPLQAILTALPALTQANVSVDKVEELGISLASRVGEVEAGGAGGPRPGWGRLELAGVTHTYQAERDHHNFTLGPLDLCFRPGELVFVVGGNGSGKTTLVKLLIGLYAPESGEVRLDGVPVTDETRDEYRQHFSAVFSDFFLFDSFLGMVTPDVDAKAREYLSALHLDQKVEVRRGVLSTTELSQGQRKRLALLTAYLEDRPVYVFDEWAADQDPLFKEIFYLQLLPELKARGKTVIVITHDDHYFHVADRVVKLEYGKVSEEGREWARGPRPGPRAPLGGGMAGRTLQAPAVGSEELS